MKAVIIFDHPYGTQASENEVHNRSFSAAVYKKVKDTIEAEGGIIDLMDLRDDNFNPVIVWETRSYVGTTYVNNKSTIK